ncbi:hypothetical protein GCM10010145_06570 [Streptomyces ruber]|uniref:Uncharacterized protein n=2 Tax=Streptomyces TaxID=1883 RepID=A0A918B9M7_9ACTN|nr:hypothetical protein [Streptomyces ruber]GGQ41084.1 hypothetical protein GCM10010145_06570 [Streptomyces ruber]
MEQGCGHLEYRSGELVGDSLTGWSLTVRQEIHAEFLTETEELVAWLAQHSGTEGVVGLACAYR